MKVLFVKNSSNKKIGPMSCSMTEKKSCPSSCMWKTKGCYGLYGNVNIHWNRLNKSNDERYDWKNFIKQVSQLHPKQIWRHNVVGDLPGVGNRVDKRKMMELIRANNSKVICFTHKPVLGNSKQAKKNRQLIALANKKGFCISLSADNLSHADQLCDLKVAPVVVVLPQDAIENILTPKGRRVLVCPQQRNERLTCSICQICSKKNREFIVGFRAHGCAKKHVSEKAKG